MKVELICGEFSTQHYYVDINTIYPDTARTLAIESHKIKYPDLKLTYTIVEETKGIYGIREAYDED